MSIVFGSVRGAIASSNASRVLVHHAASSILEEKVSLVLPMMYRGVGGDGTILVRFVFQQMDNV